MEVFNRSTIKLYQLNALCKILNLIKSVHLPSLAACSSSAASSSSPAGSGQVYHCQPQFLAALHKADRRHQYGQHQSYEKQKQNSKCTYFLLLLSLVYVFNIICNVLYVLKYGTCSALRLECVVGAEVGNVHGLLE